MNLRNQELFKRVESHPLRKHLAKALDLAEMYAEDASFIANNRDLSDEGRSKARTANLKKAVRDLRDARAPLQELQTRLETKRAAVEQPAFDKTDLAGVLNRQELRAALRSMSQADRSAILFGTNREIAFIDALLEQPAALSGMVTVGERELYHKAQEERLEELFAPQLAEVRALESSIAEAKAIIDVARNDLRQTSGLNDLAFEYVAGPIETKQNAPWLLKSKKGFGADVVDSVRVVELNGDDATYREATADDLRDGVYYKDATEYKAAQGIAA